MLYNYKTFPLDVIRTAPRLKLKRGNPGGNRRVYIDLVCAFDIETSRYNDRRSFMYIWQFQAGPDHTVIGRSWKEFLNFMRRLKTACDKGEYLCIYVHNLSFEFQFLSGVYHFKQDEVFAVESRKILRCDMLDFAEFRCSYLHSNMRLETYLQKMGVEHEKEKGFDYDKARYPWTPLTDDELRYCVNDVKGLVEALTIEMQADGDNLRTIPATSTGYVRRDVKAAMKCVSWPWLKSLMPDPELYEMLREAFRGGNTHANRFYAGQVLHGVSSYDRSSSYPDVQINCKFPVRRFIHEQPPITLDRYRHLTEVRKKAVVMRIALEDVRLRDDMTGCPYLPIDKCRRVDKRTLGADNGRILQTAYLETTVTDVDFRIIEKQYQWSDMRILALAHSRYGDLPDVLKKVIISYYKAKTALKGVPGQEIYYTKSKNKLNSVAGMSEQCPVKRSAIYKDRHWTEDDTNWITLLEKSNRRGFFPYQWGVWTTSWGRFRLAEGVDKAEAIDGFVYCDTDSVKYLGKIDWSEYNEARKAESLANGAYATDPKGRTHYMGVYEPDDGYPADFSTRGAKKYVTRHPDGKLEATIAGVSKREDDGRISGGMELEAHGGFDAFLADSFTFTDAGGNDLFYYDGRPEKVRAEGKRLTLGRAVTIAPSTYTLHDTKEYKQLVISSRQYKQYKLDKYGETVV